MDCMPKINQTPLFNTHFDCARAGHVSSIKLIDEIGDQLVDRAKLYVRFECKAVSES